MCGEGHHSGHNFDHCREWMVNRFKQLSAIFLIDICTYAVMPNHYHLVLRVNREAVESLSENEVVERWQELFKGHLLVDHWIYGESLTRPNYKRLVSWWPYGANG